MFYAFCSVLCIFVVDFYVVVQINVVRCATDLYDDVDLLFWKHIAGF